MERFILLARLIGIALLVAACASAQTPEPNRIEDLATFHDGDTGNAVLCWETDGNWRSPGACSCPVGEEFDPVEGCRFPPSTPICGDGEINQVGEDCDGGDLGGQTCQTQGFDSGTLACFPAGHAQECTFDTSTCTNDPPPPGGSLSDGVWKSIPGSEMRSIHDPVIDDIGNPAHRAFEGIQSAWGGAACAGNEMIVFGGGHGDGQNNGVFAVDVNSGTWRRVTMPSPLWQEVDPGAPYYCPAGICTPPIGEACQRTRCNVGPDGAPVARHTYDTLTSDGQYLYALGGSILHGSSGDQPRGWKLNLQTAQWTALPDQSYLSLGGGSAYVNGNVYYGRPSFAAATLNTSNDTWSTGSAFQDFTYWRLMVHATSNDRLFLVGDEEVWSIAVADWPNGSVTDYAPMGYAAQTKISMGVAYYPPEDLILLWAGGQTIETIDPHSGAWSSVTPGGEDPGAMIDNGTYSKFNWCGGKVVLLNGVDEPLYYIDVEPPEPPPAPPPPEENNFHERCNADGVVFCDPLDTEGPWGVDATGTRRLMPNPDGSPGIPTSTWWQNWRGVSQKYLELPGHVLPRLDANVKASGTGSLKFDYPAFSGAGSGGVFATNFSDDLSQQFGEGDTFYVQYRWRADCDFIYFDCDPTSPGYKTERRYFASKSGRATGFKLSIIADGDPALGRSADSCTWLEIVTLHGADHYLAGYHSCRWYEGFSESTGEGFFGSGQIDFQPNGTKLGSADDASPTCWWMPDPSSPEKRRWGYTGPDCWYLDSDEWITIQVMIRIGTWQPDRLGEPNSHVTMWAAREGEPQRVIIDHDLYLHSPEIPGRKYGKIWLLPFMTNKDDSEEHPTGHIWYDELIVSTDFIVDPT